MSEQELADRTIGIKPMRTRDEQVSVALDELVSTLVEKLG